MIGEMVLVTISGGICLILFSCVSTSFGLCPASRRVTQASKCLNEYAVSRWLLKTGSIQPACLKSSSNSTLPKNAAACSGRTSKGGIETIRRNCPANPFWPVSGGAVYLTWSGGCGRLHLPLGWGNSPASSLATHLSRSRWEYKTSRWPDITGLSHPAAMKSDTNSPLLKSSAACCGLTRRGRS